jgi:hypothetical protein
MLIANAPHETFDLVRFDHPFQINIINQRSQARVSTPPKDFGKSRSIVDGYGVTTKDHQGILIIV